LRRAAGTRTALGRPWMAVAGSVKVRAMRRKEGSMGEVPSSSITEKTPPVMRGHT